MNEKNLKLLEIAGFNRGTECYGIEGAMSIRPVWVHKGSPYRYYEPLDLYNSLDALFKWVVPKLEANYCYVSLDSRRTFSTVRPVIWKALIFSNMVVKAKAEDTTPAHALAEAILKAWEEKA